MRAIPSANGGTAGWKAGFISTLPSVQTHAKIHFLRLTADPRHEATQEAIASAFDSCRRLAAQGRLHLWRTYQGEPTGKAA
jgi:hypothetical protein